MLTVACVFRPSTTYDERYVLNLKAAVERNLSLPHEFICLAWNPVYGVNCVPMEYDLPRWWNKLELLHPKFHFTDRVLYLDLDTVITGSLDDIASYGGDAAFVEDFMAGGVSTSLMSFRPSDYGHVWSIFMDDPDYWMEQGDKCVPPNFGDQVMFNEIEHPFPIDYWQDLLPGQVVSYRRDCVDGVMSHIPDNARVVSFHGRTKPHMVGKWVVEHWAGEHIH